MLHLFRYQGAKDLQSSRRTTHPTVHVSASQVYTIGCRNMVHAAGYNPRHRQLRLDGSAAVRRRLSSVGMYANRTALVSLVVRRSGPCFPPPPELEEPMLTLPRLAVHFVRSRCASASRKRVGLAEARVIDLMKLEHTTPNTCA